MCKVKVLMLVENLPVPFDRRVWNESTALNEAGYKVSVICPKGKYPKSHEILEGISIYRYPLFSLESVLGHFLEYSIALVATWILTWVVFFKEGFDVIHSANPPDFFFFIAAPYKLLGKKFVFDHHDLTPEICDSRYKGWKHLLTYNMSLWSEYATFKTADWVISTNESYRQVAIERGKVPPQHVTVVRNGPVISKIKIMPPNSNLKKGKHYLVSYLGVMGPNDGLDYLIRAVDVIVHKYNRTDIQFTLIGSGDVLPKLKSMTAALNLNDWIEFTGRIPDDDVYEIISTADLGVAPDPKDPLNDVSTMNKIIDYMSLGKPVVSFDLKEARVSAGEAAVYAQPNDVYDFAEKIISLLENPDLCVKMGQLGRQRFLNELAWDHQKKNLVEAYAQLLH